VRLLAKPLRVEDSLIDQRADGWGYLPVGTVGWRLISAPTLAVTPAHKLNAQKHGLPPLC